jgi:hypothetical protein
MRKRDAVAGVLALLIPASLHGEGVAIDVRGAGCVVAGKYPRLNACFSPASQLARGRVYFRVAGGAPDWYYVEMKSDAPCHAGILPRPKKELVGRQIEYYVDALDRSFGETRSRETRALVVGSAAECAAKVPVAPVVGGASVAVFPSLPAGFAGAAAGIGAGATAAMVVGGAAVVGGGVALAGGSGSEGGSSPTTTTVPPTTTTTLPPVTTTTTTTTQPSAFSPVFKVFQGGTLVTGDTTSGTEPLPLVFDMCESTGPVLLRYSVDVDGVPTTAGCRSTITFTTTSIAPSDSNDVRASVSSRSYSVTMTVRSEAPNNNPKASRSLVVQVNPATGGCSVDKTGPVVSVAKPAAGSVYPSPVAYPVRFEASASDATTGNNGVALVEYKINWGKPDQKLLGPVTSGSPWPLTWTESEVNAYLAGKCAKFLDVQAYATDGCGNGSYSSAILVIVNNTTGSCTPDTPDSGTTASARGATVVSDLGVPAGAGQVVVNGEVTFPGAGRSPLAVRLVAGENRLEGTLVEARGGGTWRFELGAIPGFRADTLRVVAGEVVQVGADAVTFRLRGRPGERVVLAFQATP